MKKPSTITKYLATCFTNITAVMLLMLSYQIVNAQCTVAGGTTITAPTCSYQSISGGSGQYWYIACTSGVYYDFYYTNNATGDISQFCVNGGGSTASSSGSPYTWQAPGTGSYYISFYRSSSTWNGTSSILYYKIHTPTETTGGGGTYCNSTSVTNTPNDGTSYWQGTTSGGTSTGTASTSQTVTASGTYYYNTYNGGCWSGTSGQAVTINTTSVAGTITQSPASGGSVCNGSNVTYTYSGGTGTLQYFQYQWNTTSGSYSGSWNPGNGTGANPGVWTSGLNPPSILYVIGTVQNGVCPAVNTAPVNITVVSASTAPTSVSGGTTICKGSGATLTEVGGALGTSAATYQWGTGSTVGTSPISGATSSTYTPSPTSTTSYWVSVTGTGACGSPAGGAVGTITVNQPSVAPTTATASPSTICNGSSSTLSVSGGSIGTGGSAKWYTGSCGGTLAGTGTSISVSPTTTTTYYVRYEDPAPCSDNTACQTVTVTVNNPSTAPTSASASPSTICAGSSSTLSVTGGTIGTSGSAKWYTGSCGGTLVGTGTSISVSPGSTTQYWVRYEDPSPCSDITACQTVVVTVNSASTAPASISGTGTVCSNNTGVLLVEAGGVLGTGATYQWGTGSVVGTSPIGGATGSTYTPTPTSTTSYWVSVTGAAPCGSPSGGAVGTVTVNQTSTAPTSATATPSTICNGSSSTLAVSGGTIGTGGVAHWYTGSCGGTSVGTGTSISVSPTTTTTYYVRYEDGTPCSDNTTCQTVTVTVNTASTAPSSISGTTSVCSSSSSTTLTAVGGVLGTGATYQWGTGSVVGTSPIGGATGVTYSPAPSSTTSYWVSVTGAAPCGSPAGGARTTVTVVTTPSGGTATGPTYCTSVGSGTVTVSGVTGATQYAWSLPAGLSLSSSSTILTGTTSSASTVVYGATAGTYTVTVTPQDVASGITCAGTALNATVTVVQTPTPTFTTVSASPICTYTNTTYTTQSGQSSYVWAGFGTAGVDYNIVSGGIGSTSNTVTLQWLTSGTKTLTVSYTSSGCAATTPASTTTVVNASPTPALSTSGSACTGSTVTYTTAAGQSSYVWTFSGTSGTDYTLVSGGTSTSNTAGVSWITTGPETVTVNYTNSSGCTGPTAASNTQTVNSAPTSLLIASTIDPCNGGYASAITISGGTSPYTFKLTPPGTYYTLPSPAEVDGQGATSVTISNISDANGCPVGSISGNPVSFPARALTSGASESCTVGASSTQNFFDGSGYLMATVTGTGTALGMTTVAVTNDGSPQTFGPTHLQHYLQRHFSITPTTNASANVCLYISDAEADALHTASAGDLHTAPAFYGTFPSSSNLNGGVSIMKYDGLSETPSSHSSEVVLNSITATHNPTVDGYTYSGVWQLCYTSSFSGFYIYATNSTGFALPVTLVSFTAQAVRNMYIELNWATASEINNAGFQIERSVDGTNYQPIGWAAGHGNSNVTNDYQYFDMTAVPGIVYYYRLKQVDNDGNFAYSNIASAELTGEKGFNLEGLYPNPASNQVAVGIISSVSTTAIVTMTDMLGRSVMTQDWSVAVGYNTNTIDLTNIAAGTYVVTVTSGSIKTSKQLVITR